MYKLLVLNDSRLVIKLSIPNYEFNESRRKAKSSGFNSSGPAYLTLWRP